MSKLNKMILDSIMEGLRLLTDEARLDIFSKFCTHCGSENPNCQCWNDE